MTVACRLSVLQGLLSQTNSKFQAGELIRSSVCLSVCQVVLSFAPEETAAINCFRQSLENNAMSLPLCAYNQIWGPIQFEKNHLESPLENPYKIPIRKGDMHQLLISSGVYFSNGRRDLKACRSQVSSEGVFVESKTSGPACLGKSGKSVFTPSEDIPRFKLCLIFQFYNI